MADMATLNLTVSARPQGFDQVEAALKAMQATAAQMATAMQKAFADLPKTIGEAIKQSTRQETDAVDKAAQQIKAIRSKLADDEARLTKSASEYRIHLVEEERDQIKAKIMEVVKDRQQADEMMLQADKQAAMQRIAIEKEAAAQQIAIAKQTAAEKRGQIQGGAMAAGGLLLGLDVAAGGTIKKSIDEYKEFEQVLINISAVSGLTGDGLKQFADKAMKFGQDTKFSASEAAKGMLVLAQAGFTAKENLEAIDGALSLAAATGTEVAKSADIMAGTLRGFGLETSEAAHVADVLATAATKSAVSMSDLELSMKYIAPIARASNQSIEDVTTMIAAMGDEMIKGSQAGTTLREAFSRLQAMPRLVREELAKMQISIQDVNGRMLPFMDIIAQLKEKTAGLAEVEKNARIERIFGMDALSGIVGLMNQLGPKYDTLRSKFESVDGASKQMADRMNNSTAGSLKLMNSSIETLGITIGAVLAPTLKAAADAVTGLVNALVASDPWVKALAGGLLAAVAALGLIVTALVSATVGFIAFTVASEALSVALVGLGIAAGPLGWAILAVSAAVGAGVVAWKMHTDAVNAAAIAADKQRTALVTSATAARNSITEINGLAKEHDELAGKVNLSAAEHSRLKQIVSIMNEKYPELAKALTAAGDSAWYGANATIAETNAREKSIETTIRAIKAEIQLAQAKGKVAALKAQGYVSDANVANAEAAGANAANQAALVKGNPLEVIGTYANLGVAQQKADQTNGMATAALDAANKANRQVRDLGKDLSRADELLHPKAVKIQRGAAVTGKPPKTKKGRKAKADHSADRKAAETLQIENALAAALAKLYEARNLQMLELTKSSHAVELVELNRQRKEKEITEVAYLEKLRDWKIQEIEIESWAEIQKLQIRREVYVKRLSAATVAAGRKHPVPGAKKEMMAAAVNVQTDDVELGTAIQKRSDRIVMANAQTNALISESNKKLQEDIDKADIKANGEHLERKVAAVTREYDALIQRAGAGSEAAIKLEADKQKVIQRLWDEDYDKREKADEAAHNKMVEHWRVANEQIIKVMGTITDDSKTSFQKLADIGGSAFEVIKDKLVTGLLPAIEAGALPLFGELFSLFQTEGLSGLLEVGAAYVAMGIEALTAGAQTLAGWLMALGPIGLVIAGVAAVAAGIALVAGSMGLFNETTKKVSQQVLDENEKTTDALIKNRENKLKAETATALKDLEKELLIKKQKHEANDAEIQAMREARQAVIFSKRDDETEAIRRDTIKASFEKQLVIAESHNDKMKIIDLHRLQDYGNLWDSMDDAVKSHLLTQKEANEEGAAQSLLIDQKYYAESITQREKAMTDALAIQTSMRSAINESAKYQLESQLENQLITKSEYETRSAALDKKAKDDSIRDLMAQSTYYANYINDNKLSDDDRVKYHKMSLDALVKAESEATAEMKAEIDSYKKSVTDQFQQKQDNLDREKTALTNQMELEQRLANQELSNINELIRKKAQEIALTDQRIKQIQDQAALQKAAFSNTDADSFNQGIKGVAFGPDTGIYANSELKGMGQGQNQRITVGADDLTFTGLDTQKTNVQDRFLLKEITQAQEAQKLIEIALKKGALAQKEANDPKLIFSQQTQAKTYLKDAFKEYQDAQNSLIDSQGTIELKALDQAKLLQQSQMDGLDAQKYGVETTLSDITAKYQAYFNGLNLRIQDNKFQWDAALASMASGNNAKIQAIVASYQPLEDRLNSLIALQSRLANQTSNSTAQATTNYYSSNVSAPVAGYELYPGQHSTTASNAFGYGFARGGYARGGKKGQDSIPLVAQDGEYIIDNSLSTKLEAFVNSWGGLGSGLKAGGPAMGGGRTVVNQIALTIKDAVLQRDIDLDQMGDRLVSYVSTHLARQAT